MKLIIAIVLSVLVFAQNPEKPAPNTVPIPLSADDQKILDALTAQVDQMKPQTEGAQKQQAEAQRMLAEAQAFIHSYNAVIATRQAFLFRIAADVCSCRTSELELTPDGRGVVRKPKSEKP